MGDEEKEKSIGDAFADVGNTIDDIQPSISLSEAKKLFDVMKIKDPAIADRLETDVLAAVRSGASTSEIIGLVLGAVKMFLPF